ncbi:hypothetical protein C7271_02950 [filamentous cyanobacterium CCP5]|nr:hypothetical protein C7271_02950 [filamentous cyanobacterium CCP5]
MNSLKQIAFGRATAIAGGAFLTALAIAPVQAATYHLDFDDIFIDGVAQGSSASNSKYGISNQWANWGVTLSATNKAGTSREPLLLFDSNDKTYTGGDNDLMSGSKWGTAIQNNVLIIHEDGFKSNGEVKNWQDPDDESNGGIISFNFAELVDLSQISLLDVDDFGSRGQYISFSAYDQDGNQMGITQFDQNALSGGTATRISKVSGNNSLYDFALDYRSVARLDVLYPGSGAISGLKWSTSTHNSSQDIPEPMTTAGFFLLGLLGVQGLKRRAISDGASQ